MPPPLHHARHSHTHPLPHTPSPLSCMPPSRYACRPRPHPPTMHAPPWTEGMKHTCENITMHQTSFAAGKDGLVDTICGFKREGANSYSFREKLAKNIGCPGTGNSGSQSVSWDSCNYTNVTRESFIHCNYHWNRCAIFFRKSKIKQRNSQNITLLEEKGTFLNNKYFYGNFCRYLKFYNSLNVLLTSRFPPVWEAVHWIKGAKTMVLRSGQILFI